MERQQPTANSQQPTANSRGHRLLCFTSSSRSCIPRGVSFQSAFMDTQSSSNNNNNNNNSRKLRARRQTRNWAKSSLTPAKQLFTPDIKHFLKTWLVRRRNNPYPTKHEKICLAVDTGLTYVQVSNWFANWRRKLKNRSEKFGSKTWTSLIKTYNNNVQGNVELFSLSSNDSIWNEPKEIYQSENTATRSTKRRKRWKSNSKEPFPLQRLETNAFHQGSPQMITNQEELDAAEALTKLCMAPIEQKFNT